MAKQPMWPYIRKDLKVVSCFMLLVLLLIAGIEAQPRELPAWTEGQLKPQDGDQQEGPGEQGPQFVTVEVLSGTGYTNEGQGSDEAFELRNEVVAKVQVELTWTDDYGSNDVFRLTLLWEGEDAGSVEDSSGSIIIDAVPGEGESYRGNFTVRIEAVDCPGIIGPSPLDRDQGNDWDLKVEATVSDDEGEG